MRNTLDVGGPESEPAAAQRLGLPAAFGDAQPEGWSWRVVSPTLVCARCASLLEECRRREQRYALALGTGTIRSPHDRIQTELREVAEEARINLKLAEIEFLRHKDRHASESGGFTPVNAATVRPRS